MIAEEDFCSYVIKVKGKKNSAGGAFTSWTPIEELAAH